MSDIFILNNTKIEGIYNIPLLQIEYLPSIIDVSKYDFLIFTSKNAIYSLNSFDTSWRKTPCFAIARKTEEIVLKEGGLVEYTGTSSNGNDFAHEIKAKLVNKKVLYVRAEKVVSNLVEILRDHEVLIEELITYKTVCNKDELQIVLPKKSVIIFSSPSTIKCFFSQYKWHDSYKAVVIGETTASYLPKYIDFHLPSKLSLDACIKLARKISQNI